jgi:phosphoglucosamine mutase
MLAHVKKAIKQAETKLKHSGRLLIRKSGTESLIRVMAEGEDLELIKTVVEELVSIIERTQQA